MSVNSEFLSIQEAAAVLGLSTASVSQVAKRRHWRHTHVAQGAHRPMTFYSRTDVMAAIGRPSVNRVLSFIELRDWVDSLPKSAKPSQEECAAHVLPPFGMRDVEGLFETRKYRRSVTRRPAEEGGI
jgi:hypothetical protein